MDATCRHTAEWPGPSVWTCGHAFWLVRGEVGEDRDQFGRVATPRVVDADVGVLDHPARCHDVPGRHGQRPARIAVEGREIYAAALLDGTQFVGDLPAQAKSVRDLASRVDQARKRKPVASLRLQAVARRLLRDDDQRSAEAAYVVRGALDRAEIDVAIRAPSPPVEHEDDRAATQRLALGERPAVAVTQLESG